MNVRSQRPALTRPIGLGGLVACQDVEMGFEYADLLKCQKATFNQLAGDTFASMFRQDHKVLQIPPTTIVPRHDTANRHAIDMCNEAQIGIASQIAFSALK